MPQFDRFHIKELKDFVYYSYIHDAKLESVTYEWSENTLNIKTFNPIFSVKMDLTFYDVGIVFATRGNGIGSRETIISLTAEEDCSYLQNCIPWNSKSPKDSLCLLFQMFSGDELHVVFEKVFIEIVR